MGEDTESQRGKKVAGGHAISKNQRQFKSRQLDLKPTFLTLDSTATQRPLQSPGLSVGTLNSLVLRSLLHSARADVNAIIAQLSFTLSTLS